MSKRIQFVAAVAAAITVFAMSTSSANTTEYSHDFTDDVGDWQGDIAHDAGAGTGVLSGGAYSYFDSVADRAVWPSDGYLTEIDVYLDPATMAAGDGFDLSVASSKKDESHLRDFIFHVGMTAAGDLLVNGSNNSDNSVNEYKLHNDGDGTPATITDAGVYTFQHVFRDAGDGSLAVDLNVLDESGTVIFTTTRNNPADDIETIVGGVRYQWFIFADGPDYAIDNQLLEFVTSAPTSKDDCKKGGYEAFGFTNQGQCVASLQANANAGH